jgi:aspartyl-tRNA(Asn)/glutamyl-tRNA(Gln) amidotransferase subunit A
MADDLTLHPLSALAVKIRSRELRARDLLEATFERIARENAEVNAFITVLSESAARQAEQADEEISAGRYRGPLHGIPVSIKDLIDIAGVATTAASRVRAGHVARADAAVVTRLRSAGAVLIGKCNLHEFAFGTTSEDSAFGPPRNPHDRSRSPGGSSGGSAAAVACGMGAASIGTDTGGSIRIPAAACGVVGLKPTFGEIPTDGVVPLSESLDHVGPITRSVWDAWALYDALGGSATAPQSTQPDTPAPKLGVPRRHFFDILDDEVRSCIEAALARLEAAGVCLTSVDIPHAGLTAPVYLHLQLPEASAIHASTLEARPGDYSPPVRLRLEMGRYVLAEDYARALAGREVLRREVDASLAGVDALVLPTLPIPAPPLGASSCLIGGQKHPVRNLMLRLTQLFNLTGHPALSLPCGRLRGALPCGLQLVGHRFRTPALLQVGLFCERLLALAGQAARIE